MSIVYHNTTIDSTGQVNYTKNGVTTNLTKVYYRKNGVDTLVWSKERNQAAVSNSVVSASGGTTLNYMRRTDVSFSHRHYRDNDDYVSEIASWTYSGIGDERYGWYGYYVDSLATNCFGVDHNSYGNADRKANAQATNMGYVHSNYSSTTALSYYDYTTTLRMNLLYASSKHVKIYCNNVLTTEADVTSQTEVLTATYRDNGTLNARNATIPLKVEIYDSLGTLEETWTGTMASSATITYEG